MLETGSIIWHKAFGIGKVQSVVPVGKDNLIKVDFFKSGIKSLIEGMANTIELPTIFVKYVLNEQFLTEFSKEFIEEGKKLQKNVLIDDIVISELPFSINACVKDNSKEYFPQIDNYKDTIVTSCSCKTGHNCVHNAALFFALKNIFHGLNNGEVQDDEEDSVTKDTKSFFLERECNIVLARQITEEISDTYDEEKFDQYVKMLAKNYFNKKYMPTLLRAIAYNRNTVRYLQHACNTLTEKYCILILREAAKYLPIDEDGEQFRRDTYNRYLYYYYNRDYKDLIYAVMRTTYYMITEDEIIDEVSRMMNESDDLLDFYYLHLDILQDEVLNQHILDGLDKEKKKKILYAPDYPFTRPDEYYDSLPLDDYIDGMLNDNIRLSDDIVPRIINECSDEKKKIAILHKIHIWGMSSQMHKKVLNALDKMEDNSYLKELFSERYITSYHYLFSEDQDALNVKELRGLQRYFYMKVDMINYYGEDRFKYILYTYSSNRPIVEMMQEVDANKSYLFEYGFSRGSLQKTTSGLLGFFKRNFKNQIELLLKEREEKIQQAILEKRKQRLLSQIRDVSSVTNPKILLNESTKADVDFMFYSKSTSWHSKLDFSMSVKIGITKKYVVKDTIEFLQYFNSGKTIKYGKEFEFTHLIENIVESKRKTLKLLLLLTSGYTDKGTQKKFLPLNSMALYDIIESLKGETLYFNDVAYKVVLDEIPFSMMINGKYEICHSNQDAKNNYLVGNNVILVLDEDEHRIDVIRGNDEQIRIYSFAIENRGLSLEPCLDQFKENVFSQYYPYIKVDDSIKSNMTVSQLNINAFFDYSDKEITLKVSLDHDGKKISKERLTVNSDVIRYNMFQSYINGMGFEDGVLKDDAKILSFFSMDMTELKRYCNVYLSDSIQNKKLFTFASQPIRIKYESGIMNAFLDRSDYSDEELEIIIKAIRRKRNYVLLSGDRIIDISGKEAKEFDKTVSDLGLDSKKLSQRNEISIQQALKGFAHESNCHIDDYLYNMVNEIRNFKVSNVAVPKVNADLRPYQTDAFKWLNILSKYHVGGILADDMGLGKTLEIITKIAADDEQQPNLVVCPKSLVFNWLNEFKKFAPNEKVIEIYGPPSSRKNEIISISGMDKITYITSYDSLRNDMEYYNTVFNNLILDEAQYIKNVTAQKSISVKQIKAAHKFALTGTPIENNIIDLWSIFDFIMPGYFEELTAFKSYYSHDNEFTKLVARRIAPFVLRRTKGDVLKDLPDKYERIVSVEMLPEQRKVYDAYKKKAKDIIDEGGKAFDILPYLMRLRQICDDPSLFVEDYKGGSAKVEALSEIVEDYINNGHRILIFSQFVKGLERIEEELNEKGVKYFKITGDTASKDRIEKMERFNSSNDVKVFLISLKAGGTGLNLTGADTVIHLDPWWNVAAENQASDRAHRIGQTKNVEVIKLICENSVEQRVIELQNLKKDLIDKLISNNDESVTGVSLEDIAFILK